MSASFDPSGERIVIASQGDATSIVDIQSGAVVLTFDQSWSAIAEWRPDGVSIATGSEPRGARILPARTGRQRSTLLGRQPVEDLAFNADASRLATSSADGTVRIWDPDTGEQQLVLRDPRRAGVDDRIPQASVRPGSIAFSPDGTKLVQATADGPVRIWPLDVDDAIRFLRDGLTRTLTDGECEQYLHVDRCP